MAQPRRKDQVAVTSFPAREAVARVAGASDMAHPSPARALQKSLIPEVANASEPAIEGKWHPAASLGFILLTCGGFWTAVAVGLSHLLKAH
jgi:hypothetical protein